MGDVNKIIGIKEVKGEYQGKQYHNVNFQTVYNSESETSSGEMCEVVKIKYDLLTDVFGKPVTFEDLKGFIGSLCEIGYNKFGNVSYIRIV